MSALWSPFSKPWVIAHRGASGLLPEHTLPGYALAIEQGADVIEPDLVASADGILFARHDLGLARSTDIASRSEFASRLRAGPDGLQDWWVNDFSAIELSLLRAVQPWPNRPKHRESAFAIPSFSAILDLLMMERRRRQRPLLVYPELKHPEFFLEHGIDLVSALERELKLHGLTGPNAPVIVQCFDLATLMRVREHCGVRVVLLSESLPTLLAGVDGYGIAKSELLGHPQGTEFIAAAHAGGRMVHAWTFRDDQAPAGIDPADECAAAFAGGCDGLFCDFPATGVRARAFSPGSLPAARADVWGNP